MATRVTPPPEAVTALRRFDPELRLRWGYHQNLWIIERKMPTRHIQYLRECPSPEGKTARSKDIREGWREGYVHVLSVHPDLLCNWPLVEQTLRECDSWRYGGFDRMNRVLDDAVAQENAATDRQVQNFNESASREAHDRLQWLLGNRVAVSTPEPPLVDTGMGFKIVDKRRVTHGTP